MSASFRAIILLSAALASTASAQSPSAADLARWSREARSVTITRDDWGIPHINGKTDADAVFGLLYAQAEDDFNRVEMNYVGALGRSAETEGEGSIYKDLRMRLINNPDSLKALFSREPAWLQALMNAWADGLNYYLYKHPEVKPKVITHFEPWMPLAFSEGSMVPDIESVSLSQLAAFYGATPAICKLHRRPAARQRARLKRNCHRPEEHSLAPRAPTHQSAHFIFFPR